MVAQRAERQNRSQGMEPPSHQASPRHASYFRGGDKTYDIVGKLAQGGMAEIFLARYRPMESFEKWVVIKKLRKDKLADSRMVAMFEDETTLGGRLCHPNIAQVFDAGMSANGGYIVMEYVEGLELSALARIGIEKDKFLSMGQTLHLLGQAALAMGYFHELKDNHGESINLVHCDISPNNFLVTNDGVLKVIDFGISQFNGQKYEQNNVLPGKLSYMSPEQARREKLDKRSDIYSLGILLYELTLKQRLFRGPSKQIYPKVANGDVAPPTFIQDDYPADLEAAVMKALSKSPEDRYSDAFEFYDALKKIAEDNGWISDALSLRSYMNDLNSGSKPMQTMAEANDLTTPWIDVTESNTNLAGVLGVDEHLLDKPASGLMGGLANETGIQMTELRHVSSTERKDNQHSSFVAESTKASPLRAESNARWVFAFIFGFALAFLIAMMLF